MQRRAIILAITILMTMFGTSALAGIKPTKAKPPVTPENVEKGREIYYKRCSFCHGLLGDGNGPAADYMDPRPRDFTLGVFKFRTTGSGELPTDEDLFRTVSRGLQGTPMQAFDNDIIKNGLTEEERWQVIYYIKTFAMEFEDPELDPSKKVISLPANKAPYNADTIAKGKELFMRAKCFECHGKGGKGDGQKDIKEDDWGFPIRIRNITQPWKIKAGSEVEDIYMRFSTGIMGTPMPSFAKSFNDEERWYLANYIKSLQYTPTEHSVMKAKKIDGELPQDPEAPQWQNAEPMDVRLAGQVIAAPRWQNPSIELASVRALYNDKEIAILVEWDDPFQDLTHDESQEFNAREISKIGAYNSYVAANDMIPRHFDNFRDSIALQFPVKMAEGTKKPHFFRGDAGNPVNLWLWKADKDAAGEPAVEDSIARGYKQPIKSQPADQQQVTSKAIWKGATYKVVMKRPLKTEDKNDVQFEEGKFIPLALNAWDGSNGEHGLIMSLSSWHYLFMEAPTPMNVYIYALLGVVLTGLGEFWLVRRVRREEE
ncbi:MAG: ethylbenzene dehydrogenase-related protein [Deltaproteobacteria bacterium]|nr:ethylbenzene dehydrogenase-related protein [Deltaproteobacteria bacterium]